jgi:hypothetical protein
MKNLTEPVKLGEKPLQTVNQKVHLGIIRADKNETNLNIQEHISIARKTLYSLIPVGLNGKNGLNPVTAYKIYQAYVLPRLLYGLEVLPLNISQITELKQFHTKTEMLPISASLNSNICSIPSSRCATHGSRTTKETTKSTLLNISLKAKEPDGKTADCQKEQPGKLFFENTRYAELVQLTTNLYDC